MRKRLKKREGWLYLVILVVCFILAGAIHTFMKEPRGRDKGPAVEAEWKEVVQGILGEPVDETMMEKLRKGRLDQSDLERVEKAYGSGLNDEDRKKLRETLEGFKKDGRLGEKPSEKR